MYLIDILFKRLKLLYLYSQFNYCIYTNSLPLWWWLSWSWLLISLLDTLLDFRGVGGCDSPLVVVHIVQYFGRLRVIFTWFFVDDKLVVLCAVAIHPLKDSIYLCSRSVRPLTTLCVIFGVNRYIPRKCDIRNR